MAVGALLLIASSAQVINFNGGEDDLTPMGEAPFTLPGDTLQVGKAVRLTAWGRLGANSNEKTIRCYFGARLLASASGPFNRGAWSFSANVTRLGLTNEKAIGEMIVSANDGSIVTQTMSYATPTSDLSTDLVVKCTGEGTATGDVKQESFLMELLQ